ncbi:MAG: serine/alanine racemase [Kosmotogales bacterium]|nr:serine/alanine racemase [Kosmotogales bacterium]
MEKTAIKDLQRGEYAGIDYFRPVAAFLVITIHTSPFAGINEEADFILTGIIARVAVPFFFMTSGFFLFSELKDKRQSFYKFTVFIKKIAVIYGITILIYLPLNIYTGRVKTWVYLPCFLKDVVFDGTFYHLWYLPAAIIGAGIVYLLLKKLKAEQAFIICLFLYILGLFGDSYYGIVEKISFLKAFYKNLFVVFDYTRNGIFLAPIFFMMGAMIAKRTKKMSLITGLAGFILSLSLMLVEGLLLYNFDLQCHDSMYFMLLPCLFFLFRILILWEGKSLKYLRNLSMFVYLIHPAIIVAVRGYAKVTATQGSLIENSVIHFIAVATVSFAIAAALSMLFDAKRTLKDNYCG